jgi:CHASE3 domain sensor protein
MLTRVTARHAFAIAIGLLLVCAILIYSTLANFAESERWVNHTQQVRELLGETESDIASAARARLIYVFNGDDDSLAHINAASPRFPSFLNSFANSPQITPPSRSTARVWKMQSTLAFNSGKNL